tara:strand:+ start:2313 stop:2756 length:444 start_codon:yes stop_codon:yes gene_type:complete
MTDAWCTHIVAQTRRLENWGEIGCPDFDGYEAFEHKTLIWYDPVADTYRVDDLRDIVWSLDYGCNVSVEDAYVHQVSLHFVGLDKDNAHYALRRNTALVIREFLNKTPDVLSRHFLEPPWHNPFASIFRHRPSRYKLDVYDGAGQGF